MIDTLHYLLNFLILDEIDDDRNLIEMFLKNMS